MTNVSCKNKKELNNGELGSIDKTSLLGKKIIDDLGRIDLSSAIGKTKKELGSIDNNSKGKLGNVDLGTIDNPNVPYNKPENGSLGVGFEKC